MIFRRNSSISISTRRKWLRQNELQLKASFLWLKASFLYLNAGFCVLFHTIANGVWKFWNLYWIDALIFRDNVDRAPYSQRRLRFWKQIELYLYDRALKSEAIKSPSTDR